MEIRAREAEARIDELRDHLEVIRHKIDLYQSIMAQPHPALERD